MCAPEKLDLLALKTRLLLSEWASEATKFQDCSDSHYSVLIGCCPLKMNLCEWSLCQQGAFHWVWSVCRTVSLSETTKSPKCLQTLLNNHTEVILCWLRFWPVVQRDRHFFLEMTSHYHCEFTHDRETRSCVSASCCLQTERSWQTDGWGPISAFQFSIF